MQSKQIKAKQSNFFFLFLFFFLVYSTSPKGNDADSCQQLTRKKRRGVIEKKRRDRINSSLSELKRLVPSAYEKQGSSKLEKAEILQLTVDHLKNLHAKGERLSNLDKNWQNFIWIDLNEKEKNETHRIEIKMWFQSIQLIEII